MYNYDDNGALIITHFSPDTVTAACGVYILDGRAAWTEDQRLVEGCPPCLQAAQNADRQTTAPLPAAAPTPSAAALATTWAMPGASKKSPILSRPTTTKHRPQTNCPFTRDQAEFLVENLQAYLQSLPLQVAPAGRPNPKCSKPAIDPARNSAKPPVCSAPWAGVIFLLPIVRIKRNLLA